jgi:hypothetical protein
MHPGGGLPSGTFGRRGTTCLLSPAPGASTPNYLTRFARGGGTSREPLQELVVIEHQLARAVGQRPLQRVADLPGSVLAHPREREARPRGVATEPLQRGAVALRDEDVGVQGEPIDPDAAAAGTWSAIVPPDRCCPDDGRVRSRAGQRRDDSR